ncbi:MAG: MBL fold metallo-hydrolase, partial [Patescibacteria group bacterium]
GDLEEEEKLIGDLDSDIIKIGHHGSSNANDLEFLEKASPETAIISVGENNKFGHPHYRTLSNLEKISAQILRTDILGDIVFSSDGKEFFQIKTMTP